MKSHPTRLASLLKAIETLRLDGFLVSKPANLRYLFGFTGSAGLAWIQDGEAFLIVDGRYLEQAEAECSQCQIRPGRPRPIEALLSIWNDWRADSRIGVESNHLSMAQGDHLRDAAQHLVLVGCASEVEKLRSRKDEEELSRIRRAIAIGERALARLATHAGDGLSEIDLAGRLEFEMRRLGGEGLAFETLVASGPRSSNPHAAPSERVLRPGELLLADCGTRVDGYVGDLTRVYLPTSTGSSSHVRQVIDAVWEAQEAALAVIRPGIPAREVDEATREVFRRSGWEEHFAHSTGHGIGLEIHESPSLSSLSQDILQERMVLTIEPGLYFPDQFGVRIEDVVVVTASGCEVLSRRRRCWPLPG